jgi:phosphoribosylaminoimidazole-succinocarboxamide synthase
MSTVFTSDLRSVQRFRQGKVRDIYAVDDEHLLIVATDRLSAFDVVLPTPIPDKGRILTAMSNFWFARTAALVPNHLTTRHLEEVLTREEVTRVRDRAVIVRRLTPLPVEAIVRGYFWLSLGRVPAAGHSLWHATPGRLARVRTAARTHIYTINESTRGRTHLNISFEEMVRVLGGRSGLAEQVLHTSLWVYREAVAYALTCGIIIADTKF